MMRAPFPLMFRCASPVVLQQKQILVGLGADLKIRSFS